MSRAAKAAAIALSVAFTGIAVASAAAETQWEKNHPRRTEVNDRLKNQDRRINKELREGEITKGQARELHSQDHAIRQEERTMSKFNTGHITPGRAEIAQPAGKRRQPGDRQVVQIGPKKEAARVAHERGL